VAQVDDRARYPAAQGIAGADAQPFGSILFAPDEIPATLVPQEPDFFRDLNLDQVVAAVTSGRDPYDLAPLFYTLPASPATVAYRHEILRELERAEVRAAVTSFADGMRAVRSHLARAAKIHNQRQERRWFLQAGSTYCDAVERLGRGLDALDLGSMGLQGLREHVRTYVRSDPFRSLSGDTHALEAELANVRYGLHIRANRIRVDRFESGIDYGADVSRTFRKFEQGATKTYTFDFSTWPEMNHVEAGILELVARLYPGTFAFLDRYGVDHRDCIDPGLERFDREVQVYLAWLEYIEPLRRGGLAFCYPQVSGVPREIVGRAVFDVALAAKLAGGRGRVVTNDVELRAPERLIVVTGPNQGGKTTFARTIGQLHYLGRMGLSVPGETARMSFFDRLFTHFERDEDLDNMAGKLEDDLLRIRAILDAATPESVVIMNESFSSTTLHDALLLSRDILRRILASGALCVSVTFMDELASLSAETVSMVGTVDPVDPAIRTFRIVRRPADGMAYAVAIARKHGLTLEQIRKRITAAPAAPVTLARPDAAPGRDASRPPDVQP